MDVAETLQAAAKLVGLPMSIRWAVVEPAEMHGRAGTILRYERHGAERQGWVWGVGHREPGDMIRLALDDLAAPPPIQAERRH